MTEAIASADLTAFLSHHTCGFCHLEGWSQQANHEQRDTQIAYGATSESHACLMPANVYPYAA